MDDRLWHLVIDALPARKFAAAFEEQAGELAELDQGVEEPTQAGSVRVLDNGLAVLTRTDGSKSLYETRHRYEYNKRMASWAKFARGYWTESVPAEPGLYFCKDRDLGRVTVRELKRQGRQMKDVSGGLAPWGQVTTWQGYWWSEPMGALPEAY